MRFERVDGYNAIKDNENEVYTLCEYEPKEYNVAEQDVEELLNLLNNLHDENMKLRKQLEEDK